MLSELAPGFLVAAPALLDPNFRRSVVLLVEHRADDGALGFVINRPADLSLADMRDSLGVELARSAAEAPVLVGGPVAPHTGWVVFEHEDPSSFEDVVKVADHLGVTASRELLEALASGRVPGRMLLVLGYAGWARGQLEAEIAQGAWIPVDLDARIVFDTPHEERWSRTLGLLGIDPARLSIQHSSRN